MAVAVERRTLGFGLGVETFGMADDWSPRIITAERTEWNYDIVVVGGGLAGMMAGKTAAELGANVAILEQHPIIGVPVKCAEGITKIEMEKFFLLEFDCPKCIAKEVKGFYFVAPNGKKIFIGGDGYILDKGAFNQFLAQKAEDAGALVLTKTKAIGFQRKRGGVEVKAVSSGEKLLLSADVVIAADGPTSPTARWAGINKRLNPADTIIGVQYLMETGESKDFAEFYFGEKIAPKGYAWVFPKGDGMANIGLGITIQEQRHRQSVDEYLNKFVRQKFPNGKIINKIHGIVPVGDFRRTHTANQVIAIGDAGRLVNPATGGGNRLAMETGAIAAEVASDAILDGDTSKTGLAAFERQTLEIGKKISRHYKIRMALESFSDNDFNAAADVLEGKNFDNISLPSLMLKLFVCPALTKKVMRAVM